MDYNIILGKSTLTNVSDAYSGILNIAYSQYTNNGVYLCKIDTTNTTISPTLSLNGLTAYPIKRNDGTSILVAELKANAWYLFMFDQSTSTFEILNLSIPYFNGTTNYVAKYTPTGNVLGISQIFDNGTNVGIGTSSPTSKLQIVGTDSTSSNYSLKIDNSASSPLLYVRNDGFVGIGTNSPSFRLHVASSEVYTGISIDSLINKQAACYFQKNGNVKWNLGIDFAADGTSNFYIFDNTMNKGRIYIDTSGNIKFGSGATSAYISSSLLINSLGNVGIGTDSPNAKLSFGSYFVSNLTPSSTEQTSHIKLYDNGLTFYGFGVSTNSLNIAANESTGNINFYTNSVKRMTIDSNGNVGIGTSTPTSKLQIVGSDSTSSNYSLKIDNSASSPLLYVRNDGVILANNLPTSASGLPSGAIWNNGGILNIV